MNEFIDEMSVASEVGGGEKIELFPADPETGERIQDNLLVFHGTRKIAAEKINAEGLRAPQWDDPGHVSEDTLARTPGFTTFDKYAGLMGYCFVFRAHEGDLRGDPLKYRKVSTYALNEGSYRSNWRYPKDRIEGVMASRNIDKVITEPVSEVLLGLDPDDPGFEEKLLRQIGEVIDTVAHFLAGPEAVFPRVKGVDGEAEGEMKQWLAEQDERYKNIEVGQPVNMGETYTQGHLRLAREMVFNQMYRTLTWCEEQAVGFQVDVVAQIKEAGGENVENFDQLVGEYKQVFQYGTPEETLKKIDGYVKLLRRLPQVEGLGLEGFGFEVPDQTDEVVEWINSLSDAGDVEEPVEEHQGRLSILQRLIVRGRRGR